ncbi:MAG: F0F1 ATP synthase subunit B [Gammaproteobacteria bacterium]|jgi:F-type H+-transporting ATPase subunit b
MHIEWWTLALQAINFLVLVWLLWRFLYRPVREVIEKRRALSEEAFAEAAAKEAEVDALKKRVEEERTAMAQERQEMLKKLHEDSAAERDKLLAQSHEDANKLVDEARESIARERKAALKDLQEQVGQLAVELASRLLGQIDASALGDAFLEKLEERLTRMSDDDRDELGKDLDGAQARLAVVTATPLPAAEQDRWRKRLAAQVGRDDKIVFETDPEIVGGAELRFPHTTLTFSWADQLRKARKVLQGDDADT